MKQIEIVDDAIAILSVNQTELSERYFGKSHGYVSSIRARRSSPSTSALSHFSHRLQLQLSCIKKENETTTAESLRKLLAHTEEILMQRALNACGRAKNA